jgi:hypothetical protein
MNDREKLQYLIEKIGNIVPYALATIDPSQIFNQRKNDTGYTFGEVSINRCKSAADQLNKLLNAAQIIMDFPETPSTKPLSPEDEMLLAKLIQNAASHGLKACMGALYKDRNFYQCDPWEAVYCCALDSKLTLVDSHSSWKKAIERFKDAADVAPGTKLH